MNQLRDILRFKKELYFNGAVQVDWFYQQEKQTEVAKSFVFHGPEYFGVSDEDISFKTHRLVDTATFTNILANKLYGESPLSNFFMTIAPYGTGKSHMAVSLATLFSGESKGQQAVINNLKSVDKDIARQINDYDLKPNLVLVLNGMKDFNLNYEILNATQKVLDIHNVEDDFLKTLTKSYDIAKNFVSNTYSNYQNLYLEHSKELSNPVPETMLKEYLVNNILQDSDVFEVINKVYYEINGTYIRWDEGVSAGDVLEKIAETLCGERNKFNKVVVFFDEFGRYIEFASSFPTRAADAALQQIYEAVQNSDDKIMFVGFIQSDLKSYLTRVDRASNINRYIGRYEASEKIHLSSNLETIFSNLIERTDPNAFKALVVNKIEKDLYQWKLFHEQLLSWTPQAKSSSVWGDFNHFKKVVLEGIYPLHPLTSWMLSNLSSWLQQRSSLTFLEDQINLEGEKEINEFGDLVIVPATRIVRTEFFNELLAAEQDGRKQSEYCILYNQILMKYNDKFDERQKELLAANLIARIGRFKTRSAADARQALAYASNLSLKEVETVIQQLEGEFGVLSFDESANVYDFIDDAIGINDFKRLVNKKKSKMELDLSLAFDTILHEVLNLNKVNTSFGARHFIKTTEWQFTQKIVHVNDLNPRSLSQLKLDWQNAVAPDVAKGQLLWVYVPNNVSEEKITNIKQILKSEQFSKTPIVLCVLEDTDNTFYEAILEYQVTKLFTEQEEEKYGRFIIDYKSKTSAMLSNRFIDLTAKRIILTEEGNKKIATRPSMYMEQLFEKIYNRVIPFPFTEFENKALHKAKRNLSRIGRVTLSGATFQMVHSETADIKSRIEDLLFNKARHSWGIFNQDYQLISPTNPSVLYIFNELDKLIEETGEVQVQEIFDIYQSPPFGINDYALALLIGVYLVQHKIETRINLSDSRIRLDEWSKEIFQDKNVNFKALFATTVFHVNPEETSNRYLTLFKKVNQNNDVKVAHILFKEYEKLKFEEDIPLELEDKVANLEYLLKEGQKLYEKTQLKFAKMRANLNDALKKNDDLKVLFDVLDEVTLIKGPIDGSEKYIYSVEELELARAIEDKCHQYIETNFNVFLKGLKCQSMGQASAFEKWVYKTIESLNRYDYREEARQLRSKKDKVLDNLALGETIREIENTISQFVRNSTPSVTLGYSKLIQIKEEANKNLDYIEKSKVSLQDKTRLHNEVTTVVEKVEDCLRKLNDEVSEIYDAIYDISTVEQCENFFIKVKQILNKEIREEDREGIEEAANHLQNFLNDIRVVSDVKNNRDFLQNETKAIKDKWLEIESEIDFLLILKNHQFTLTTRLDEQANRWREKYIVKSELVKEWEVKQCITWLKETQVLPSYLTDSIMQEIRTSEINIQQRLSELSIDAVLGLFTDLSESQQKEALEKMKQMLVGI